MWNLIEAANKSDPHPESTVIACTNSLDRHLEMSADEMTLQVIGLKRPTKQILLSQ